MLDEGYSFDEIGRILGIDGSTRSREVGHRRIFPIRPLPQSLPQYKA